MHTRAFVLLSALTTFALACSDGSPAPTGVTAKLGDELTPHRYEQALQQAELGDELTVGLDELTPVQQDELTLVARLTAAEEAPPCPSGAATGTATIRFVSETAIEFVVEILNPHQEIFTAGHIHVGPPGVAGPVVVPLFSGRDASVHITVHGRAELTSQLAAAIRSHPAAYYVNFHTTVCPGGATRGQLASAQTHPPAPPPHHPPAPPPHHPPHH